MVISGVICATGRASNERGAVLARISIVPLRSVNQTDSARTRLAIALALAAVVFVIEAAASIFANSLALLAEAFHVLIDLVALGIAFVAVWLAARPPTERRSFGCSAWRSSRRF